MSTSRKLSAVEQSIHQAALGSSGKVLAPAALAALVPDVTERTTALNFLLGAGLLKTLKNADGKLSFRGVVKGELELKKDLSAEENLVLSHIAAAGNEGIWTKHLKDKTELHQVVLDRCLKILTQKQLVKVLKGSVQQRNRRIYMLFHLEPSAEMTGGPWYTDKELDTEFIKLLSQACLKFILDRSFPRSKNKDSSSTQRVLYPISASPPYPTAIQVQAFLNKSKITETQLTVEHVEMLLNVLEVDGSIEKVPALGAALWESTFGEDSDAESSEDEARSSKAKKRKRKDREDDNGSRKKKRRKSESSSEEDSSSEDERRAKSKSKKDKKKKKSRRNDSDSGSGSDSDSDSDSDSEEERKKKKKRKARDESDTQGTDGEGSSKRSKSKSKKKSKKRRHDSSSSESDSGSDSDSDTPRRSKSRSKSKSKSRSKSKLQRESSPNRGYGMDDTELLGGAHVYRAIHQERMLGYGFGLNQAPCGRCPTFEFCKDGGPVNAGECVYYGEWLDTAETKLV